MTENKMPAFQFYPSDWRSDPGVQSLSYHERGVWFEMLCMMHESSQRGKLLLNGKAMPIEALARALGLLKQDAELVVEKLIEYGVASRNPKNSVIFSRRMVKDEHLINVRRKCGKMGGNPNLLKQKSTTPVKQKSTPSSSSSSSSSSSHLKDPHTPPSGGILPTAILTSETARPREAGMNPRAKGTNPRAITKKILAEREAARMRKLREVPREQDLPDAEFIAKVRAERLRKESLPEPSLK